MRQCTQIIGVVLGNRLFSGILNIDSNAVLALGILSLAVALFYATAVRQLGKTAV